jgi:hypothetical protein
MVAAGWENPSVAESPERFRNPFRNEADAFRVLVMILVAAGVVIAAAELVGSWLGDILGVLAIALGIYATIGWLRQGLEEPDEPAPPAGDGVSPPERR